MKYNKWLVKGLHRLTQFGQQMAKLYGKTSTRLAAVTAGSTDLSQVLAEMEVVDLWYTDGTQKSLVNTLSLKADLVAGLVPANQLPSYVDDVLEFADFASFPVTGESAKIYYALDTGSSYRWTGSAYFETNSVQEFYLRTSTTVATSGAITALDTGSKSFIRFSSATTLHSLVGIGVANLNKLVILTNTNTVDLLIKNESTTDGTAANRILSGTGKDFKLKPTASCLLIYDYTLNRWKIIGGAGSGSAGDGLVFSPSVLTANLKDGEYNDWSLLLTDLANLPIKKVIFKEETSVIPFGDYKNYIFVGSGPFDPRVSVYFNDVVTNDWIPFKLENINLEVTDHTTTSTIYGGAYYLKNSRIIFNSTTNTPALATFVTYDPQFYLDNSELIMYGGVPTTLFTGNSLRDISFTFTNGCSISDDFLVNFNNISIANKMSWESFRGGPDQLFPIIGSVTKTTSAGDPSTIHTGRLEEFKSVFLTNKGYLLTKKSSGSTDYIGLAPGTNGKILSANSAQTSGLEWIDAPVGGTVQQTISSAPVSLTIGCPVYWDGTKYAKARTNNIATIPTAVASVLNGGDYTVQFAGIITLTNAEWDAITGETGGLTVTSGNNLYYCSDAVAGQLTRTSPPLSVPVLRGLINDATNSTAEIKFGVQSTESGQGDTLSYQSFTGDGVETTFTLNSAPAGYAYTWCWIGGVFQIPNDSYTISGADIIFSSAPANLSTITIQYAKSMQLADVNAVNRMVVFSETVSGSPKNTFNLATTPAGVNSVILFVGGSIQDTSQFTLSGNILTTLVSVGVGVQVIAYVLNSTGVSSSIDSYIRREPWSLADNATVIISTIFGSQVSGVYRFQDSADPRINGTIGLLHNGSGNDPDITVDTSNVSVSTTYDTASSLNFYISSNELSIQNKLGRTCQLKIFREV